MLTLLPKWFDPTEHVEYLSSQNWVEHNPGPLLLENELAASEHLWKHIRGDELYAEADKTFRCEHFRYHSQDKKFAHLLANEDRQPLGPHVDCPTVPEEVVNGDNFTTVLAYLTDDYEGGRLLVPPADFKPKAGTVILMDGSLQHEVQKCRGRRIVAVTHLWRT